MVIAVTYAVTYELFEVTLHTNFIPHIQLLRLLSIPLVGTHKSSVIKKVMAKNYQLIIYSRADSIHNMSDNS